MIRSIQQAISIRFRALLCGSPDGMPPWLDEVASGDGEGFFLPGDAPWIVHGDMATLVGGVRALLMQALHPGSLMGVKNHSRYSEDPLGRLAGTIRWLTITTFGSHEAIAKESMRVRGMHAKVKGEYRKPDGKRHGYDASDPALLLWVHIAFMDSFLRCHQAYSNVPIPGGADSYIALWAKSVEPLGLATAPKDEASLLEAIETLNPSLKVLPETEEVVRWLRRPPLPPMAGLVYRLLFQAACCTLPEHYREMLGLKTMPSWLIRPVTRVFLTSLRVAIGPENPLQDGAVERLRRGGFIP